MEDIRSNSCSWSSPSACWYFCQEKVFRSCEHGISYLERFAVLPDVLARRAVLVPDQFSCLEVFCLCPAGEPGQRFVNGRILRHYSRGWEWSKDLLHHCEVLPVVVGLEECEPEVELKHDTP